MMNYQATHSIRTAPGLLRAGPAELTGPGARENWTKNDGTRRSRGWRLRLGSIALLTAFLEVITVDAGAQTNLSSYVWDTAKTQPYASLHELGLENPATVFVPGRYSASGRGSLYINGQILAVPNLTLDVLGFLENEAGFIVAHYDANESDAVQASISGAQLPNGVLTHQDLDGLTPEQRVRMLEAAARLAEATHTAVQSRRLHRPIGAVRFLQFDKQGHLLSELATLDTVAHSVTVTRDAIFVAQAASAIGPLAIANYFGIDRAGRSVRGPQGVLFATPSQSPGEWYVRKLTHLDPSSALLPGYRVVEGKWKRDDDRFEQTRTYGGRVGDADYFVHTTAAFVESRDLTDSVRTGYVMRVWSFPDRGIKSGNRDWYISPYSFSDPLPKRNQIDCFGLCNHEVVLMGQHTMRVSSSVASRGEMSAADFASLAARRSILVSTTGGPGFASQLPGNGALEFGLVALPTGVSTPLFQVLGQGENLLRGFIGSNGNEMAFNSGTDVYLIVGSKGKVLVRTDRPTDDAVGYDILSGRIVNPSEMRTFLARFGFRGT